MEILDLYNKDRVSLGSTMIRGGNQPPGTYRMVVHIGIFNSNGQMLIQHRQPFKSGWPDKWDVTVGGCAVSGETSQDAVEREVYEEIGLKLDMSDVRPALTPNFDKGFDDFYLLRMDVDIDSLSLQYEEVKEVRWASLEEILNMIEEGTFVQYQKDFMRLLFYMKDGREIYTD